MVPHTYVLENSFHQRDRDLCLLHEVIFSVLDFNAGSFLFRGASGLQSNKANGFSGNSGKNFEKCTDVCLAASSSNLLTLTA